MTNGIELNCNKAMIKIVVNVIQNKAFDTLPVPTTFRATIQVSKIRLVR